MELDGDNCSHMLADRSRFGGVSPTGAVCGGLRVTAIAAWQWVAIARGGLTDGTAD